MVTPRANSSSYNRARTDASNSLVKQVVYVGLSLDRTPSSSRKFAEPRYCRRDGPHHVSSSCHTLIGFTHPKAIRSDTLDTLVSRKHTYAVEV